ncbi:MAG: hypothetical protein RBU30_17660 [Polyangia bacterium]|jgi:hypothetical protein|nr:hypothetical protein [Polyangia bacterium]
MDDARAQFRKYGAPRLNAARNEALAALAEHPDCAKAWDELARCRTIEEAMPVLEGYRSCERCRLARSISFETEALLTELSEDTPDWSAQRIAVWHFRAAGVSSDRERLHNFHFEAGPANGRDSWNKTREEARQQALEMFASGKTNAEVVADVKIKDQPVELSTVQKWRREWQPRPATLTCTGPEPHTFDLAPTGPRWPKCPVCGDPTKPS